MNPFKFKFWSFNGSVLFCLLASYPTAAEIISDTTLPVNSSVTPQGNIRLIEGGTPAGNNLFHSFQEFSFSEGTAFFNNDMAVRNIIIRVTGGLPSNINGIIGANGIVNLFFINPNGIVFGSNAALQIGGSFVASTANSLKFADGIEFSATAPQTSALLTVSVPIGLQFSSSPGRIVNQSQASPNGEFTDADPPNPIGLKVPIGKTLVLVGGKLALEGGNLTTTGGRIELGSVARTGLVNLTEIAKGYALNYVGIQNFEDIQISQGAIVYGSGEGGGDIQLQGRNVKITEGSLVFSNALGTAIGGNIAVNASKLSVEEGGAIGTFTLGEGQAGNVLVRASDSVEVGGSTSDGLFPSVLGSQVFEQATGNGGNLTIETGKLVIRDGAAIDVSTFGAGSAGNVLVRASDSIEVRGRTPDGSNASGIFAQVAQAAIENAGNAGTLTLETKRLTVQGGAQISTAARQNGNGGNLTINASDSIQLSGTSPLATASGNDLNRSGVFIIAAPEARGNVGKLNLTTGLLSVENGARISADNFGIGQGATQTLNVRQLVARNGGEIRSGSFAEGAGGTLNVNATESIQVIGTGTIDSTPVKSTLFSQAQGAGKAGNLNITTPRLNVEDGAEVTVSSQGSGSAGNLTITANEVRLNRGSLTGENYAGDGANINLQNLDLLLLQNQSLISAQAFNNASGGNINIDAANGFIVAIPGQNNDIIANASQGQGGRIEITSQGNVGIEEREATSRNTTNDIDASSEFGSNGTVTINIPNFDPYRGLLKLSTGLVNTPALVSSSCGGFGEEVSELTVTGRGGLPLSPEDFLSPDVVWTDTRLSATTAQQDQPKKPISKSPSKPEASAIVPATGWMFNNKGDITLISSALNATGLGYTPVTCS
ncbi:filamentous hemagglutinin N-terminal domain-containing protein [Nostoc sp. FACHB-152]|uniref:two-partner secretion domain-containing protein n=1 Tax=unclassified Nostoc TaxID=2593658 RepID=UPI0016853B2A|nr:MULTISPECIES: filamentous hemagglutinin N-terminal domain-containing protein [unclassified Nostoc]MBD2452300.1 filamentous hemagglutinin N-terminal domain-containing protein [Nostoc sp. FACHB-152]MBD2473264.1 filamentous hemagglutinin N-terminal domain-containing protein [Nostoc sp. FACHB-145]